jgi:hypothetical protein
MQGDSELQHDGEEDAPPLGGFQPFSINLAPIGDDGSRFHTQNDPAQPLQRTNYIERKGAVEIRCSCVAIVHGLLAPDSNTFCTLLVLEFRFDPRKRARRISSVDMELRFSGLVSANSHPEVSAIAPCGHFDVAPTTQSESSGVSANLQLGGGAAPGPTVGTGVTWDRSITRDMTYAATVTGATALRGRNFGGPNCASWTLLENPATKTGVPVAVKAAVLLRREHEEQFQCVVTVKAHADWRSSLESVLGSTPPDDPVLFDPTIEATNAAYDEMNLGQVNLEPLSRITFSNVVSGSGV